MPEAILEAIIDGRAQPFYIVSGDRVVAEPAAARIARAVAEKIGCDVETLTNSNFGVGRLIVGADNRPRTVVVLADDIDNGNREAGAESFYIFGSADEEAYPLRILSGSTLALKGPRSLRSSWRRVP